MVGRPDIGHGESDGAKTDYRCAQRHWGSMPRMHWDGGFGFCDEAQVLSFFVLKRKGRTFGNGLDPAVADVLLIELLDP